MEQAFGHLNLVAAKAKEVAAGSAAQKEFAAAPPLKASQTNE